MFESEMCSSMLLPEYFILYQNRILKYLPPNTAGYDKPIDCTDNANFRRQ